MPVDINANFHLKKGTVFVWQHKYKEAKKELNTYKYDLLKSGKNEEILAEIEFQLAKNEQFQHNYDEAISRYLSSKEKFENSDLKQGQMKVLNNLGMIYFGLLYKDRDNKKALEYYTASAELAKEMGNYTGIARAQMNIAGVQHKEGKSREALQTYILALENFKSSKNNYGIALSHASLGNIYGILGNNEKNYYHSKLALDGLISVKDKNSIGMQAGEVADAAKSLGNKKDYVIYNYLSVIYRRASKDKNWKNNFSRLKEQETIVGAELFGKYIKEAVEIAKNINMKLQQPNINLDIPV